MTFTTSRGTTHTRTTSGCCCGTGTSYSSEEGECHPPDIISRWSRATLMFVFNDFDRMSGIYRKRFSGRRQMLLLLQSASFDSFWLFRSVCASSRTRAAHNKELSSGTGIRTEGFTSVRCEVVNTLWLYSTRADTERFVSCVTQTNVGKH